MVKPLSTKERGKLRDTADTQRFCCGGSCRHSKVALLAVRALDELEALKASAEAAADFLILQEELEDEREALGG